jgi:hypothetical protein
MCAKPADASRLYPCRAAGLVPEFNAASAIKSIAFESPRSKHFPQLRHYSPSGACKIIWMTLKIDPLCPAIARAPLDGAGARTYSIEPVPVKGRGKET